MDEQGTCFEIEQWLNDRAAQYLGCKKSISKKTTQLKVLRKKCDDFARVINISHLIQWETETFYLMIYHQSVNYCLPTSHFTFKELNAAETRSHRAFTRKMGFNGCSGNAVMYHGPEEIGDRDLFHLYDEQGFRQIKLSVNFWRTPESKSGILL
jgi:hypothetical protein